MSDLCVVHLVWKPLGPAYLRRFLAAYRGVRAGRPHRLVVALNGFAADELAPCRALLSDVPHDEVVLPSPMQDIPAYLAVARTLACEMLCFCNSYSEPLADGWLGSLHAHACLPGVGLVGASGSWESHRGNLERVMTPAGLVERVAARLRRGGTAAASSARAPSTAVDGSRLPWRRLARLRRELARARERFEPFPTPHVRTNGFMVRRELFLDLDLGPLRDKGDALEFESGRWSLTRQVEARGLAVLMAGRDGRAYPPDEWWRAGGYRSGLQENLLVADNRTGEYATMLPREQERIRALTWGQDPVAVSRLVAARTRPRRPPGLPADGA